MIELPKNKIYNSYMIETSNREVAINTIKEFISNFGFDTKMVYANTHPDFQEVKLESREQRETIFENIINKLYIKPILADRKVFIIYSDKQLEFFVQNMLLKTLEEPPEYVSIFIITNNRENFLDTIKSRVVLVKDTDLEKNSLIFLTDEEKNNIALFLSNLKFEDQYDIARFSVENKDNASNVIYYIISIARDSLYYKKSYDKKNIINIDKIINIESIADTFSYLALGTLISETQKCLPLLRVNVDKELMINNIFFKTKKQM